MPGAIVSLARTHMRHPMNIRAESGDAQQTVPATAQFIYQVHDLDKPELVARILQAENSGLTIVFTRTKRAAQRLADDLEERGFDASPLHGDMQQVAREKALTKFRSGNLRVLVATDVAARGIDVADVTHVINYSCPEDEKTYVHRIGRTGRAGATGIAVTFVDWADVTRWKTINKALDLPFENPAETYSTSEHFFHDMGIAPGTKGRIVPAKPPEPKADRGGSDRSGSDRGGSDRSAGRGPREDRQDRPRRSRSRSRAGQSGESTPSSTGPADAAPTGSAPASQQDGAESGTRSRNRRRRRSGSSTSAAGGPAASASSD
jgi:superfamily II DNA/RNA helicase